VSHAKVVRSREIRKALDPCNSLQTSDQWPLTESQTMGIALDLSRSDVENLLAGLLAGAQGVELGKRLTELRELPMACRTHLQLAEASGCGWVAWSTPSGPVVAWGNVEIHGSRRINAYLLLVERWDAPSGHHALWCYCDLKRPTEWTVGRGGAGTTSHVSAHADCGGRFCDV
jgi:hypothetical protein